MEESPLELAVVVGGDDTLALDAVATWPPDDVTRHVLVLLAGRGLLNLSCFGTQLRNTTIQHWLKTLANDSG